MSNELILKLPDTGQTLKAIVWGQDHATRWNGTAFVSPSAIADADWATGMVAMTEQLTGSGTRTGTYVGDFPAAITTAGEYWCEFVAGDSPAPGQAARGLQRIEWLGASAATLTGVQSAIGDLATAVDGLGSPQQTGEPVTLPVKAPTGYGGANITTSQVNIITE